MAAHVAAAHSGAMSALSGDCTVYMGDVPSLVVHYLDTMVTGHGSQCDLCGKR
jgi:hypothetical protein